MNIKKPFLKISVLAFLFVGANFSFHAQSTEFSLDSTRVGVSGPVHFLDGETMFGGYVSILHSVAPNVLVGGETGSWNCSR